MIQRVIESPDVPLQADWMSFICLDANKADLSNFLSNEIMVHTPLGQFVIVAGRYTDICKVQSNKDINTTPNGKS